MIRHYLQPACLSPSTSLPWPASGGSTAESSQHLYYSTLRGCSGWGDSMPLWRKTELTQCSLSVSLQKPTFAPHYSKMNSDLFIEVARHCLESAPPQRKLVFLGHAGLAYNNWTPELPSWVPDWTVTPVTSPARPRWNCRPAHGGLYNP
jgi:hypothetical protein